MALVNLVTSKYQLIVSEKTLGYMSKKELEDKVPELFKAYMQAYDKDRPDIKVVTAEQFSFPAEQFGYKGTWHIVFAYHKGQVQKIPVENYFGKSQSLLPDSMFLDCITGGFNSCYLYVHPQNAMPLLEGSVELTDEEGIALYNMIHLKPFARKKEFYETKYKEWKARSAAEESGEYEKVIKSLADKSLVKLSSSGAGAITLKGKNQSVHLGEIKKKYRMF